MLADAVRDAKVKVLKVRGMLSASSAWVWVGSLSEAEIQWRMGWRSQQL